MSSTTAGYSGTPLSKKLGIKTGSRVLPRNPPEDYLRLLQPLADDVVMEKRLTRKTDIVHVFVTRRKRLSAELESLRHAIRADAAVWVSWPKAASGVETDIVEGTIRELCLPLGFVDVKVCAVDAVWSGLKLVIRRELR